MMAPFIGERRPRCIYRGVSSAEESTKHTTQVIKIKLMLLSSNIFYLIINAVTFRRENLFSFLRVTIMIFLAGSFACRLIHTCIGSGLGIYNGLFHSTVTTQSFDLYIYSIGAIEFLFPWFTDTTDLLLSAIVYMNSSGQNTAPKDNSFLETLESRCKELYNNLSEDSVLKRSDSLVCKRINLSHSDLIRVWYKLNPNERIQDVFSPGGLPAPGIYSFMSKDKSDLSYYIGSSVQMRRRYSRHMFNLKHEETRYSQACPKLYNYIRKYGLESLEFGSLLTTQNYLVKFSGFELQSEEISLLKLLTQLDLLITEQYFLNTYAPSLNVASYVGTRESSVLSAETRKKMSDSHIGVIPNISKKNREFIQAKANEA